jgi:hypothetical protein
MDASPEREPVQDGHSAESQPVDNGENNGEAPKEEASPVAKMLEKIKQYLPGKH